MARRRPTAHERAQRRPRARVREPALHRGHGAQHGAARARRAAAGQARVRARDDGARRPPAAPGAWAHAHGAGAVKRPPEFDVAVVGAGLVGAAFAAAAAKAGFKVALLEARAPAAAPPGADVDLRVSALSRASENLLRSVGAW